MRRTPLAQEWLTIRAARASAGSGMVEGKQVDMGVRCSGCGRRLAEYVAAPYAFICPRCKSRVESQPVD